MPGEDSRQEGGYEAVAGDAKSNGRREVTPFEKVSPPGDLREYQWLRWRRIKYRIIPPAIFGDGYYFTFHYSLKTNSMPLELLTQKDLYAFKLELIAELRALFSQPKPANDRLLKSCDVRKLLRISPGTLQNLRRNKVLPFTRVGGILYYHYEDVAKLCGRRPEGR